MGKGKGREGKKGMEKGGKGKGKEKGVKGGKASFFP